MPRKHSAISFTIEGEPERWRRVARNARSGKAYVPRETQAAKDTIAGYFKANATGHELIDGPCELELHFYTHSQAKDLDNMLKLIMDAFIGVAYVDDRQVEHVDMHVRRGKEWEPQTIIVLRWSEEY